jgi:hypothetical protein
MSVYASYCCDVDVDMESSTRSHTWPLAAISPSSSSRQSNDIGRVKPMIHVTAPPVSYVMNPE